MKKYLILSILALAAFCYGDCLAVSAGSAPSMSNAPSQAPASSSDQDDDDDSSDDDEDVIIMEEDDEDEDGNSDDYNSN